MQIINEGKVNELLPNFEKHLTEPGYKCDEKSVWHVYTTTPTLH